MRPAIEVRARAAIGILGTLAALCLVQCGESERRRAVSEPQQTTNAATSLAVEARLPEGDTPARASVDVVFDRAMTRLGEAPPSFEEGRRLLALEPQPAGTYSWIGTRTLSFTATGGLPVATAFRARVPAGVTSIDGSRLPQDVVWEFTTPRPQLVASIPATGDSLAQPGDPLLLVFNVPVEPQAVAAATSMQGVTRFTATRPDSALLAQTDARFIDAPAENRIALAPEPALRRATAYELVLGESLRARTGPLGPTAPIRIAFQTYLPPSLVDVTAEGSSVVRLRFATPVAPDSVAAYAEFDPAVIPSGNWSDGKQVYLAGDFGVEKRYRLRLRAGLPDLFGQRLASPADIEFTTGKRGPVLQLLPEDAVLLPSTPRDVAVIAASMRPVRLRARLLGVREEIRNRNEPAGIPARWALEETLPGGADGKLVRTTVKLEQLLPKSGLGAVLVEATSYPLAGSEERDEWRVKTVLRWSDLGLSLKASPENGIAWTTSLGKAAPRAGVQLRVLDPNGRVLWKGTSDKQGMARLPGTRALGRDLWQLTLVGIAGRDTATSSFMPDWRLSPWRFDIPGVYGSERADQRAFLYGDRDIYRPGETVHLAGLVRRTSGTGLTSAGIDSVEMLVRDPLGREFLRRGIALDAGGFALDVATTRQAVPGRYWIEARLRHEEPGPPPRPEWQTLGSLGVELAAYRAAAFRTRVRPQARQVFPGGTLAAEIVGEYFFGAPLGGAGFEWHALRERFDFEPKGFAEYSFGDPDLEIASAGLLGSGRGTLDEAGRASLRIVLPPDLPPVPQALQIEATVRDRTGDAVTGRAATIYHPARVYAGVRVDPSFVLPGESVRAQCVAVQADTALASPGTPLELQLVRREWRSIRKLLVGGRVGFETATTDSVLETRALTAAATPVVQPLAPAAPGFYRVLVRAQDGARKSPTAVASFYVAGASAGAWQPEDAIRLEMTAERKRYAIGDTARLLVTTPVHATRAWLTVEREGVLESRLLELRDGSQVVTVPVREAYLPNVYVSLAAVEPALAKSAAPGLPEPARLPRFVMGYAPLVVQVDARRLAVAVRAGRDEYAPGEKASLELVVQDAAGSGARARLGVAVVDEAVLALLGTSVPDPFEFFYKERPLAVSTGDTRLRLSAGSRLEAARFKAEAGGDGAERLAARSLFTTTAYWNPVVQTDDAGRARVEFTLPDNLTRFRVVAVAASGVDRFGTGVGGFRVTKALTLEPALPRFATAGDTLDLACLVTNRGQASVSGTVRLISAMRLRGSAEAKVKLGSGESHRVAFRALAERAGDIPVRFEARLGNATDAVAVTLPVEAARVPRVASTAAHVRQATREEIVVPAASLPGSAHLEVGLAASALGGARPAYDYVVEYPYWCLEQLASRLLVLVTARDLFAVSGEDAAHTTADRSAAASDSSKIADTIGKLEALVLPYRGFSFWKDGPEAPPWLECYAALALGRAERAGWRISPDVEQAASMACVGPWRGGPPSRNSWRQRGEPSTDDITWWLEVPVGLGLLALSERVQPGPEAGLTPADVDQLADHALDLAPDEQLLLALALSRWSVHRPLVEKILQQALQRAEVTAGGAVLPAFTKSGIALPFRTTARATSLGLWLASEARPADPLVPRLASGLLASRAGGHWGTTQDDALALLALASYRDAVERRDERVVASVHLGAASAPVAPESAPLVALDARAGDPIARHAAVQLPFPGVEEPRLRLDFAVQGPLHYTTTLRWDEDARGQQARETGITIERRLDRFEGKGTLRLGDLVLVTLTLVVPRTSWYLAVVDPLPAGLEIVQTEFATESRAVASTLAAWRGEYPALPVVHRERDDRELRLFTDEVPAGVYVYRYVTRVRAAGGFAHAPARVEAMYTPELSASTAATRFTARGPAEEKR